IGYERNRSRLKHLRINRFPKKCQQVGRLAADRLLSPCPLGPHKLLVGDQRGEGGVEEQPLLNEVSGVVVAAGAEVIDGPVVEAGDEVGPGVAVGRIQVETDSHQLDPWSELLV